MKMRISQEKVCVHLLKQAQDMGKSRGRSCRGGTTVLQNYNTTVFHTYIPYNDLKHYKKDKKDDISKNISDGRRDGPT